jgi:hypothetical protein
VSPHARRAWAAASGLVLLVICAAPAAAQRGLALAYAPGTERAALADGVDSDAASRAAETACGPGCRTLAVVPASYCLAFARGRAAHGWSAQEFGRDAAARERAVSYCQGSDASRGCAVIAARCLAPMPAPAGYGSATPLPVADPRAAIVVIYSHGSEPPTQPDPCEMDRINAAYGVPWVVHALDGETIAGRRVVVDGFCTPTRVGVLDPATGRLSKLVPRAREIAQRAAAYVAAGVPARQVIVAGHSAGGWASLMALRDHPEAIAAAIAFAPAGFDRAATRPPDLQALRARRYAEMTAASRLPALIFGFDGDAFESPNDLSALAAVSGVEVVAFPDPGPAGRRCVLEAHIRVRDLCFSETQAPVLRRFIAAMLADR